MNRIILIGNGFDLAHGLKTSYKDFLEWFWGIKATKMKNKLGITVIMLLLLCSAGKAQDTALDPYVNFLGTQQTSAKDYILNLFRNYDIVILCERDHREITQYDLYLDIIGDKWFTDNVQQVYFEIGNALYNDTLNRFLHNPTLGCQEISAATLYLQRNLWAAGAGLWNKGNYSYYLKHVHQINTALSDDKKVNVFGLDLGVDWETATENDIRQIKTMYDPDRRDSMMAVHFFRYYEQSKTKKHWSFSIHVMPS
jgi:hypothetical protein